MRAYHFISLLFLLCPCFFVFSGEDYSGPFWVRVMTDRGDSGSRWYMVSSPGRQAVKKLILDFPVSELSASLLEYDIQTEPYDPKLKQHIISAKHPWANILIKINDQTVLDAPASQYIRKGRHHIPLPAGILRQGENVITMTWKEIRAGNPELQRYGYIYFTQDLTGIGKEADLPNLRIRLLLQFRNYGAESNIKEH